MRHPDLNSGPAAENQTENPRAHWVIPVIIAIAIILGGLFLGFSWSDYRQMREAETLELAQSVSALLPVIHITRLAENIGEDAPPHDQVVERSLTRLVEVTKHIHYAYVLGERDGVITILADSSAAETSHSKSIRQTCEEAANLNPLPFETGGSVLTGPVSTPCGRWMQTLVPVWDAESGRVIAALGLSFSAGEWQAALWRQMIPNIVITLCLLLLLLVLLRLRREHAMLREKSEKLAITEALYHGIFEKAPIGIVLQNNNYATLKSEFSGANPMAEAILGRTVQELVNIQWPDLTHPGDLSAEQEQLDRFVRGETEDYSIEKRILQPDGSITWINLKIVNFSQYPLHDCMYLCLIEDISVRKKAEADLIESERGKSVLLSHLPGMAYRCKYDENWTMEFVSEGCRNLTGYAPESLLGNRDLSYNDIISPEYRDLLWREWARVVMQRKNFRAEYELVTKTGECKWVLELGQGIYGPDGKVEALEGIVLDISEKRAREAQLAFLTEHDFLTGLYNPRQMKVKRKRLDQPENWPLSVAVCDINGLHMINDTYGLGEGDRLIVQVAKLIHSCCRPNDVLGRVGGGEFMLLMPHTDSAEAHRRKKQIKSLIEGFNRSQEQPLYDISLSIGHATKDSDEQSMEKTIKIAENHLKRRKLLTQASSHHAIVSSILATLYAKSQETEAHGERLGRLCRMMGEHLGLDQKILDDLQLLSMLHDIGKIGVDDRILNKAGKLSGEEWTEMRQHPEIGCRIAMSTPQLMHIAQYILHHHEHWDGQGYPLGLKGLEIPLLSRILAVADAYDAMIEDRVYRKALPWEAALEEIERCAGTQFDPDIAWMFIRLILEEKSR